MYLNNKGLSPGVKVVSMVPVASELTYATYLIYRSYQEIAMSRIAIAPTIATAPAASQPLLEGVQRKLGSVPNLFRLIGNSAAGLEGYLGLSGALAKGAIRGATADRIALAIGTINGCDYCLAAHTFLGRRAGLSEAEVAANRDGGSLDAQADAAVRFAVAVSRNRGKVSDAELAAVRAAGYSDAAVVEIVQHVALNVMTNYMNSLADTEIDFPVAPVAAAA